MKLELCGAAKELYEWHPGPGLFLDIGAHDGHSWSEGLEYVGWDVICLEPHPRFFLEMRKNRPKAILCNAAASNRNGRAMLLATEEGRHSSIEPGHEYILSDVYEPEGIEGFVDVPCTTIDRLLELVPAYANRGINVVVIDTEGHELSVLQGFDLKKWRPRLVVVEQAPWNQLAGQEKIRAVDKYMLDATYVYIGHRSADSWYAWKASDIMYWKRDEHELIDRWFGEKEDDARVLMARWRQGSESKRV